MAILDLVKVARVGRPSSKTNYKDVARSIRVVSRPTRLNVLDVLRANGSLRVGEVAEKISQPFQTASNDLRALHEFELVSREIDPNNRAAVQYSLTDRGKSLTDLLI